MATPPLSVVIHGHFYQPPREDPWLECVEGQPSAAPYHDWNTRITQECYRAVVAARMPGPDGRIAKIVNTLEYISFNFGPTLLEWMEMEAPEVYRFILTADARSQMRTGGYGNAIAQAYHHTILPLASRREKVSEVRWGIADFRKRFGRDPVGMWLPETAVDGLTLDVLAQEGIAFTIVAPHQVEEAPPGGLPGLYRTPSGRSVALFVYNGPLSHGLAFGSLLQDAEEWARSMAESMDGQLDQEKVDTEEDGQTLDDPPGPPDQLVSMATDGETFGHHHLYGEMALAAALDLVRKRHGVRVENFASFLSRNPPEHEVTLVEPSSWSCPHGVERWRAECGCKMDPSKESRQEWRSGLREAMEWLASEIHRIFETEGGPLLGNPWEARDSYGPCGSFETNETRALELLELERQAQRLFTSCGWFFDDLAGVEPIQVLRYAARALELVGPEEEVALEEEFLARLEKAVSNESPPRNGREIFLQEAKPRVPAYLRVAAGAALWDEISGGSMKPGTENAQEDRDRTPGVPGYRVSKDSSGTFRITHRKTGKEWTVAARIRRPSAGPGTVGAQETGESCPLVWLDLGDIPDGFRLAIIEAISERIPDSGKALTAAVAELCRESGGLGFTPDGEPRPVSIEAQVERVRDLADLHTLLGKPIPFDAQTIFFRFIETAGPAIVRKLGTLRIPLGFTPAP
ncbi:MAG: DUF3536 domain-containing protein [Gemmatimonadota bacterium]|jgi:hypothetical protein